MKQLIDKYADTFGVDLKHEEGEDKLTDLKDAIERHVKPYMTIHVREGAYAALRELMRVFWGTKPEFNIVIVGCKDYALDLVHCKLVRKLVTARASESATQGRSLIIRRAFEQRSLKIENWSNYSLVQRLMAGALGFPFLPTNSLKLSSIAEENESSFMDINDPFDENKKVSVVRSLVPDVSFVHGWASDRNGNLILGPAILSGEAEWGAFASKKGVIATVEKLVSTEFIREHANLVSIPGYYVKSVSVTPFGSHPLGLARMTQEFEEYESDYEFMEEHRQASKDAETLNAWLKEWVLDCSGNDEYLRKLGYQRLAFLKGKAGHFNWRHKVPSLLEYSLEEDNYTPQEMMIIASSRKVKEKILNRKDKVIIAGIGTGGLAAWIANYQLKTENVDVELMLGTCLYGWSPRPGDPQVTNLSNLRTCKMISDVLHTYGIFSRKQCLAVLGGAQIDKFGNINSTQLSDRRYLVGSGGANDAASLAGETIVVMAQGTNRFVDTLPYITCPGRKVTTVISDKGIFEKINSDELILTGYFDYPETPNVDEIVKRIKKECGWELIVSERLERIAPPSRTDLALLRLLSAKATVNP